MGLTGAPKYSILIPTRNGVNYLGFAIESVLSQDCDDFELIVSDNHSTDGTAEYLSTLSDPRLRHIKPTTPLSMVSHFEFVTRQARGEWVTVLGDDDGLMPFFFDRLNRMHIDNLETNAIVFRRAYYTWDGCQELQGNNVVYYSYLHKKGFKNNFLSILFCLTSAIDYMHLPQLYTTGLVRRDYITAIGCKSYDERFFHSDTPDADSAIALASNCRKHYRFEEPLFWTGTSNKSIGFSQESNSTKIRSNDFDALNSTDQSIDKYQLPIGLRDVFDLTIIFYRVVQESNLVSAIWKTKTVYYIMLAGLCRKDKRYYTIVSDLDKSKSHALKLFFATTAVVLLNAFYNLCNAQSRKSIKAYELCSSDRQRYPTIREASHAVSELWAK